MTKKIYGEFQNFFLEESVKVFDTYPALQLYSTIAALGGSLRKQKLQHFNPFYPKDRKYAIDYVIQKAADRFGVKISKSILTGRIKHTKDYKKWFEFHRNHLNSMSAEDKRRCMIAFSAGTMFVDQLPEGKWQDYKIKSVFTKKRSA